MALEIYWDAFVGKLEYHWRVDYWLQELKDLDLARRTKTTLEAAG